MIYLDYFIEYTASGSHISSFHIYEKDTRAHISGIMLGISVFLASQSFNSTVIHNQIFSAISLNLKPNLNFCGFCTFRSVPRLLASYH